MDVDQADVFQRGAGDGAFVTTHWSVVLRAAQDPSPDAEAALAQLYKVYAYPLYSFLRRRGQDPAAAQDTVQEIFLSFLEKNQLASVSPDRGRFRSYLLAAAHHRMTNEWRRRQRQRHGGGRALLELDALAAEERYRLEPLDQRTPDLSFDRQWALALLETVHARLRDEFAEAGKRSLFEALRVFLSGDAEAPSYEEVGKAIGQSPGAARVAVHRLRQRYRDLLRAQVMETISDPAALDDELRHLVQVLRQ